MQGFMRWARRIANKTRVVFEINRGKGVKHLLHYGVRRSADKLAAGPIHLAAMARARGRLQEVLAEGGAMPPIVFWKIFNWNLELIQRPNHIARALARLGYPYIFCTTQIRSDRVLGLRRLEPRLWLSGVFGFVMRTVRPKINHTYSHNLGADWSWFEDAFARDELVLYEHIDDLSPAIFGPIPESMLERHRRVAADARIIKIVTASRLQQDIEALGGTAHLVPNGCDVAHFRGGFDQEVPEAVRARLKPGLPVIGYFGALATWTDYDLIRAVATQRPDWQWLLYGFDYDGSVKTSGLAELPNLTIMGPIPYQQLPAHAQVFDVATVPFRLGDLTQAVSPIKLFEYMAMGLPIVSADMIECRKYKPVLIADAVGERSDPASWIARTEEALRLKADPDYKRLLAETAEANSWEARGGAIDRIIRDAMAERGTPLPPRS